MQKAENLVAGFAVEIARRFVAEQQRRVRDYRARDAHSLLLAPGELAGIMFCAVRQAHDAQRRRRVIFPLGFRQVRQEQRQFHVAFRGEHGQQVVKLEDKADVPRAPGREFAVGEFIDVLARDAHAAARWAVQPADQIQQRAFSGA